jgi:tetratricopeptide (TPR) repeat protein
VQSFDEIPGSSEVQKGRSLAESGEWKLALQSLQEALLASSEWNNDPDFLNDLAVATFHNGNSQLALKHLDDAILLQPDYGYRYAARGWMKQAAKDTNGAIQDYEKALELDPQDAITQNNLGILEEQLGRIQSAKERFAMADELDQVLRETNISASEENPVLSKNASTTKSSTPQRTSSNTRREIMQALLTSKGRKEFIAFLRNGFKLND